MVLITQTKCLKRVNKKILQQTYGNLTLTIRHCHIKRIILTM